MKLKVNIALVGLMIASLAMTACGGKKAMTEAEIKAAAMEQFDAKKEEVTERMKAACQATFDEAVDRMVAEMVANNGEAPPPASSDEHEHGEDGHSHDDAADMTDEQKIQKMLAEKLAELEAKAEQKCHERVKEAATAKYQTWLANNSATPPAKKGGSNTPTNLNDNATKGGNTNNSISTEGANKERKRIKPGSTTVPDKDSKKGNNRIQGE